MNHQMQRAAKKFVQFQVTTSKRLWTGEGNYIRIQEEQVQVLKNQPLVSPESLETKRLRKVLGDGGASR